MLTHLLEPRSIKKYSRILLSLLAMSLFKNRLPYDFSRLINYPWPYFIQYLQYFINTLREGG